VELTPLLLLLDEDDSFLSSSQDSMTGFLRADSPIDPEPPLFDEASECLGLELESLTLEVAPRPQDPYPESAVVPEYEE